MIAFVVEDSVFVRDTNLVIGLVPVKIEPGILRTIGNIFSVEQKAKTITLSK